jgi:hypothetical protein
LEAPEGAYQLTVEERAAVAPGFDPDALERLLREIRPDMRGEILSYFQAGGSRGHLVEIHDPELQVILEEVWAPFWDNAPDQALEENWYRMPGREIAMAHRIAKHCRGAAEELSPQIRSPKWCHAEEQRRSLSLLLCCSA